MKNRLDPIHEKQKSLPNRKKSDRDWRKINSESSHFEVTAHRIASVESPLGEDALVRFATALLKILLLTFVSSAQCAFS